MRAILAILVLLSVGGCETQEQAFYASLGTAEGPLAMSPLAQLPAAGVGALGASTGALPPLSPGYCYVRDGSGAVFRMSARAVDGFAGCVMGCANPSTGAISVPMTLPRSSTCPLPPIFPHAPLAG